MDKRRLIYMVLFVILCFAIGFAIYRVFFYKGKEPVIPGTTSGGLPGEFPTIGEGRTPGQITQPSGQLPESGIIPTPSGAVVTPGAAQTPALPGRDPQKKLVEYITDVAATSAAPSKTGGVKFYNQLDGKFYIIDAQGNIRALSDEVFYNVEKVNWSPVKNESIIEYPDGANIYYNFEDKKQVTLPKHWEEFSFSHLGNEIAAKSMGLSPENRWLIASSPDGTQTRAIEALGENAGKVDVDWSPNQQVVALSRTGEPLGTRQEVLLVGLNQENFKSITVEGRGLESIWSPEGGKLLHSVYNERSEYKPELWVVDASPNNAGANRRLLNINTWAHKCTMVDERFAYCAVPEILEAGAGFAPALSDSTPDQIVKIDTVTGSKTELPIEETHTIDSIFIGDGGKTLYFTDKHQSGIFKISI